MIDAAFEKLEEHDADSRGDGVLDSLRETCNSAEHDIDSCGDGILDSFREEYNACNSNNSENDSEE